MGAAAGVGLWQLVESSGTPPRPGTVAAALAEARPARSPFPGLTEARLRVGGEDLRVVVADETGERSQGLRRRRDLGPYDGMAFVYSEPTDTAFTMSTVPVPLEIGFYDGAGRVVSRLRMEPCAGTDAECPRYRPDGPFRYAIETLAGELPAGRLTGGARPERACHTCPVRSS